MFVKKHRIYTLALLTGWWLGNGFYPQCISMTTCSLSFPDIMD